MRCHAIYLDVTGTRNDGPNSGDDLCKWLLEKVKDPTLPFDALGLVLINADGGERDDFVKIELAFFNDPDVANAVCNWGLEHAIQLFFKSLEDVDGIDYVLNSVRHVTTWWRSHKTSMAILDTFSPGKEFVLAGETRFGTTFLSVDRFCCLRQALQASVQS